MTHFHLRAICFMFVGLAAARLAVAIEPPSRPGVDAPELAQLGPYAVGVKTITLIDRDQWDVTALDAQGVATKKDRPLTVDIWYPAKMATGGRRESYAAVLEAEPPAPVVSFNVPGIAVRNAKPEGSRFPFVIVSHGARNVTAMHTWLTENLASKGYVVAAIRHADPGYGIANGGLQMFMRRPLDIAFVARSLQSSLAAEGSVDPAKTALVGYSMGGYGVLAASGAVLQTKGPMSKMIPGGLPDNMSFHIDGLKATVAIAPAGATAWAPDGLRGISTPLFLIAGDRDPTVDYKTGARAFFDTAVNARRYLLTYQNGGHNLALGTTPPEMRDNLWNQDWFEDAVWRKERTVAINLHFITAFLDRHVKGDVNRDSYLDVPVVRSSDGSWAAPANTAWNAISPGTAGVTLWKGFQRRHAEGLELLQRPAASEPAVSRVPNIAVNGEILWRMSGVTP